MASPAIFDFHVLQLQAEATYRTAPAAGSPPLSLLHVYDVQKVARQIPHRPRKGMAGSGNVLGSHGPRFGGINFSAAVYGTAGNAWGLLLESAGLWLDSAVYRTTLRPPQEVSSGTESLTARLYDDGQMPILRAAVSNLVLVAATDDEVKAEVELRGIFTSPAAEAVPAYTTPTALPILASAGACTIGGITPVMAEARVALNNRIANRVDINSDAGGAHGCVVTGRDPTITVLIERLAIATYAPEADRDSRTTRAISLQLGSAGNRVTIAAGAAEVREVVDEDREGVAMQRITFGACRTAGTAGNNELTITLD